MTLKDALRQMNNPERYFQPAKKKGYICPVCKSGSGAKGTGVTSMVEDGILHYTCWTGCFTKADIVEIIKNVEGLSNGEAFKRACEIYGIDHKSIEYNGQYKNYTQYTDYTHNTHNKQEIKEPVEDNPKLNERIKADIEEAQKHIEQTDYYKKRGLSLDVAKRFRLGYLPAWKNPKNEKAPASPRLIIPTSEYSYLARDTRDNLTDDQKKYSKIKAGNVSLFNAEALEKSEPCFILEGEIDALSVIEAGFNAVALGSCSNRPALIRALKNIETSAPLILYLDKDEAGQKADKALKTDLEALGITCTSITGQMIDYKDANDYLIASKDDFKRFLSEAIQKEAKEKEEAKINYISTNNALSYLDDFLNGIKNNVNTPYTPTGFKRLDSILDGGLYEGLYILGAISSLGKTTFILQVADQIAKSGRDVLFFSLEQARTELMAKSISRETCLYCEESGINTSNAKSARGITVAERYKNYSDIEKKVILEAIRRYRTTAKSLYIYEGVADISVKQIKETVEKHIKATGNKPIVFIDYLQILAPSDDKSRTDKQITDLNITALKRLSRSLKLSIIGISSFNRDNYSTSVNMSSFKESGAIEYSSDVLIGLQFNGIDELKQNDSNRKENNDFTDKAKSKNPREVELKILKNRNGATSKKTYYKYYPLFNFYKEVAEEELKA